MKYLLLLILGGCSSFGSNIQHEQKMELKGSDKVDATFLQSRQVESPQPSNVNLSVSGNSSLIYNPAEEPILKESINTDKGLKSSAILDQSISDIFSQHSSMFYFICAFAFLMFVVALKWLESTKTAKAVFAVGDMIGGIQRKLIDTDRGTDEHKALSQILSELEDRRNKIK